MQVKIPVLRGTEYYNCNIFPLLLILNIVAISLLALDTSYYFKYALMTLNVAFVEIGLCILIDKDLSSVGY